MQFYCLSIQNIIITRETGYILPPQTWLSILQVIKSFHSLSITTYTIDAWISSLRKISSKVANESDVNAIIAHYIMFVQLAQKLLVVFLRTLMQQELDLVKERSILLGFIKPKLLGNLRH